MKRRTDKQVRKEMFKFLGSLGIGDGGIYPSFNWIYARADEAIAIVMRREREEKS